VLPYPNYRLYLAEKSPCPNCSSNLTGLIPEKLDDNISGKYPLFYFCFNCRDTVKVLPPRKGDLDTEIEALPEELKSIVSEPFIKLLKYQDEEIRNRAIRILSLIGTPVIPKLAELLAKKIENVQRRAIIEVLGNIKDKHAAEVLIEALSHRATYWEAREGLVRLREIAIEPIQKVLRGSVEGSRMRGTLLSVLGYSGGLTDIEQIVEALENLQVDADIRMWAASKLGEFQNEQILGVLMRADKKEWHFEVRAYIKESIEKIKTMIMADPMPSKSGPTS
jgi:hypothetical protein